MTPAGYPKQPKSNVIHVGHDTSDENTANSSEEDVHPPRPSWIARMKLIAKSVWSSKFKPLQEFCWPIGPTPHSSGMDTPNAEYHVADYASNKNRNTTETGTTTTAIQSSDRSEATIGTSTINIGMKMKSLSSIGTSVIISSTTAVTEPIISPSKSTLANVIDKIKRIISTQVTVPLATVVTSTTHLSKTNNATTSTDPAGNNSPSSAAIPISGIDKSTNTHKSPSPIGALILVHSATATINTTRPAEFSSKTVANKSNGTFISNSEVTTNTTPIAIPVNTRTINDSPRFESYNSTASNSPRSASNITTLDSNAVSPPNNTTELPTKTTIPLNKEAVQPTSKKIVPDNRKKHVVDSAPADETSQIANTTTNDTKEPAKPPAPLPSAPLEIFDTDYANDVTATHPSKVATGINNRNKTRNSLAKAVILVSKPAAKGDVDTKKSAAHIVKAALNNLTKDPNQPENETIKTADKGKSLAAITNEKKTVAEVPFKINEITKLDSGHVTKAPNLTTLGKHSGSVTTSDSGSTNTANSNAINVVNKVIKNATDATKGIVIAAGTHSNAAKGDNRITKYASHPSNPTAATGDTYAANSRNKAAASLASAAARSTRNARSASLALVSSTKTAVKPPTTDKPANANVQKFSSPFIKEDKIFATDTVFHTPFTKASNFADSEAAENLIPNPPQPTVDLKTTTNVARSAALVLNVEKETPPNVTKSSPIINKTNSQQGSEVTSSVVKSSPTIVKVKSVHSAVVVESKSTSNSLKDTPLVLKFDPEPFPTVAMSSPTICINKSNLKSTSSEAKKDASFVKIDSKIDLNVVRSAPTIIEVGSEVDSHIFEPSPPVIKSTPTIVKINSNVIANTLSATTINDSKDSSDIFKNTTLFIKDDSKSSRLVLKSAISDIKVDSKCATAKSLTPAAKATEASGSEQAANSIAASDKPTADDAARKTNTIITAVDNVITVAAATAVTGPGRVPSNTESPTAIVEPQSSDSSHGVC